MSKTRELVGILERASGRRDEQLADDLDEADRIVEQVASYLHRGQLRTAIRFVRLRSELVRNKIWLRKVDTEVSIAVADAQGAHIRFAAGLAGADRHTLVEHELASTHSKTQRRSLTRRIQRAGRMTTLAMLLGFIPVLLRVLLLFVLLVIGEIAPWRALRGVWYWLIAITVLAIQEFVVQSRVARAMNHLTSKIIKRQANILYKQDVASAWYSALDRAFR